MNWNKIKEKHPKAYQLFDEWSFDNNIQFDCPSFVFRFFDEQGVYIDAEIDTTMEAKFSPTIYSEKDEPCEEIWRDEYLYRTRTEAEEKAFEKAFEILEDKLK